MCGVPASGQREGSPGRAPAEKPESRLKSMHAPDDPGGIRDVNTNQSWSWESRQVWVERRRMKGMEKRLQKPVHKGQNWVSEPRPATWVHRTPNYGPHALQLQPTLTHLGGGKPLGAHERLG